MRVDSLLTGSPAALIVLAAWTPIVLIAFRTLGARRSVPIAMLGGFLLLPRWSGVGLTFAGAFPLDKRTVPGIAVLLAVVLFDRAALARFRPRAVDLAMVGGLLASLAAGLANGPGAWLGSIGQVWINLGELGLPYLIGRIYYGDQEGPRRLGTHVVMAGLCTLPIIVFEMIMGDHYFLSTRIYGTDYLRGMTSRLGGWRPEGFLASGLEMAEWTCLVAVLATWMWAVARWRPAPMIRWLSAPALTAAAIACRGVYGYAALALGMGTMALTGLLRTRLFLMALTLVPPAYVTARVSGLWDGRVLIDLAAKAGNAGTTLVRIDMEDRFIGRAREHGIAFGFGGIYPDWKDFTWAAEGRWVTTMSGAGLVGVALHYAALMTPAVLIIWRWRSRRPVTSPEFGLALFIVLHAIDSLHNYQLISVVPLMSGALSGFLLVGKAADHRRPPRSSATTTGTGTRAGAGHATYRLGDIIDAKQAGRPAGPTKPAERPTTLEGVVCFVLSAACLLYVFGHARVDGQGAAKFVGGLGSALLFAAVGAVVAGSPRRSLARVAAFGLAFGWLGITFNLALHASSRPFWSADILQGMALCGVVVAGWRRLTGGGSWAYASLAALAASWWAVEPSARPFPGSQYLFEAGSGGLSPFPVLPWLTLSALGAWLVGVSTAVRVGAALILGSLAAMGWSLGPVKFPLNPIYAMAGGSLASVVFVLADRVLRSSRVRVASGWLGRRWLLFFYLHLGLVPVLERFGLVRPVIAWSVLASSSIAATWLVSSAMSRLRRPFHWPVTWVILLVATAAVGSCPGLPVAWTVAVAGGIGLAFAARHEDLAALILGPTPDDPPKLEAATWAVYASKLALVAGVLTAPEWTSRLPEPFGRAPRPAARRPEAAGGASASTIPGAGPPTAVPGGSPNP